MRCAAFQRVRSGGRGGAGAVRARRAACRAGLPAAGSRAWGGRARRAGDAWSRPAVSHLVPACLTLSHFVSAHPSRFISPCLGLSRFISAYLGLSHQKDTLQPVSPLPAMNRAGPGRAASNRGRPQEMSRAPDAGPRGGGPDRGAPRARLRLQGSARRVPPAGLRPCRRRRVRYSAAAPRQGEGLSDAVDDGHRCEQRARP